VDQSRFGEVGDDPDAARPLRAEEGDAEEGQDEQQHPAEGAALRVRQVRRKVVRAVGVAVCGFWRYRMPLAPSPTSLKTNLVHQSIRPVLVGRCFGVRRSLHT